MAKKVKNINGTGGNSCTCGSWLNHWKEVTGKAVPEYCSEEGCLSKPTLGAHVQKDGSTNNSWYIIPMCATHNKKTESLKVSDSTTFASANVSETCG